MLLPLHIVAGGLAIVLGGAALLAPKGRLLHRRAGLLFVYAMLTMGISGSILAARQSWTNANVMGGAMCGYFVVTALTTVRPPSAWTRRMTLVALAVGVALALLQLTLGIAAFRSPRGTLDGVPFFMLFFLGTVTSLADLPRARAWATAVPSGSRAMAR